jgi:hypothetical protein
MAKNIMADVAKLLGVELEEEFKVKSTEVILDDCVFMFSNKTLVYRHDFVGSDNVWRPVANLLIIWGLLKGEAEIIKLPWKPKHREEYYMPLFSYGSSPHVVHNVWIGDTYDQLALKAGIVYRTREEAEAHLREDYKKLTGWEWKE